jgi:hypothetical protein
MSDQGCVVRLSCVESMCKPYSQLYICFIFLTAQVAISDKVEILSTFSDPPSTAQCVDGKNYTSRMLDGIWELRNWNLADGGAHVLRIDNFVVETDAAGMSSATFEFGNNYGEWDGVLHLEVGHHLNRWYTSSISETRIELKRSHDRRQSWLANDRCLTLIKVPSSSNIPPQIQNSPLPSFCTAEPRCFNQTSAFAVASCNRS